MCGGLSGPSGRPGVPGLWSMATEGLGTLRLLGLGAHGGAAEDRPGPRESLGGACWAPLSTGSEHVKAAMRGLVRTGVACTQSGLLELRWRGREVLAGLPGHTQLRTRCWGAQDKNNKAQFHPATC